MLAKYKSIIPFLNLFFLTSFSSLLVPELAESNALGQQGEIDRLKKDVGMLTAEKLYAFLMGILLQEDVTRLIRDGHPVCIAGSDPFRSAYRILLADGGIPAEEIPEETADCASAYGAWYLWTLRSGK